MAGMLATVGSEGYVAGREGRRRVNDLELHQQHECRPALVLPRAFCLAGAVTMMLRAVDGRGAQG